MKTNKTLMLCLIGTMIAVQVQAADTGSCGQNCAYTITGSKLVISAIDQNLPVEMTDYSANYYPSLGRAGSSAPWGSKTIEEVEFVGNVTHIGSKAFYYSGLQNVKIPDTVLSIGDAAFQGIQATSIEIPGSVVSIESMAFAMWHPLELLVSDKFSESEISSWSGGVPADLKPNLIKYSDYKNGVYTIDGKKCTGLTDYKNGNFIVQKRIYTIDEATRVVKGNKNKFTITYR